MALSCGDVDPTSVQNLDSIDALDSLQEVGNGRRAGKGQGRGFQARCKAAAAVGSARRVTFGRAILRSGHLPTLFACTSSPPLLAQSGQIRDVRASVAIRVKQARNARYELFSP